MAGARQSSSLLLFGVALVLLASPGWARSKLHSRRSAAGSAKVLGVHDASGAAPNHNNHEWVMANQALWDETGVPAPRAGDGNVAPMPIGPTKWVRSSDDAGVARCDMEYTLPTAGQAARAAGLTDVMVPVITFWKLVLKGRLLYVKGTWTYPPAVLKEIEKIIDSRARDNFTFSLKYGGERTLGRFVIPQKALYGSAGQPFVEFAYGVQGNKEPSRLVHAIFELPDKLDGDNAMEYDVQMEGSVNICHIVATVWGQRDGLPGPVRGPAPPSVSTTMGGIDSSANPGGTPLAPRITFLITPMWAKPSTVMSLLIWNLQWHEPMGVTDYLLYTCTEPVQYDNDQRAQALYASGKLNVLLWGSIAEVLQNGRADWFSHYKFQTAIYNHGLLVLWPRSQYILVADLDEFFFTYKPMTVPQAYRECMDEGYTREMAKSNMAWWHIGAAAGKELTQYRPVLVGRRRAVFCVEDCNITAANKGEMHLWDTPTAGQGPHPLTKYAMVKPEVAPDSREFGGLVALPKDIAYSPLTSLLNVHGHSVIYGGIGVHLNISCAGWFHAGNMWYIRFRELRGVDVQDNIKHKMGGDLLWPVAQKAGEHQEAGQQQQEPGQQQQEGQEQGQAEQAQAQGAVKALQLQGQAEAAPEQGQGEALQQAGQTGVQQDPELSQSQILVHIQQATEVRWRS